MKFTEWLIKRQLQEHSALAREVWVSGRQYTVEDMPNGGLMVTSSDGKRSGSIIGSAVGAGSLMDYPELRGVLDADMEQKSQKERIQKSQKPVHPW